MASNDFESRLTDSAGDIIVAVVIACLPVKVAESINGCLRRKYDVSQSFRFLFLSQRSAELYGDRN